MRIYWWQAGVHIEPESDEERIFLGECTELKTLVPLAKVSEKFEVSFEVLKGGSTKESGRDGHNKESIILVDDSANFSLE